MATEIWYLGWAAFQMTTEKGTRILLDPLISGCAEEGIPEAPAPLEALFNVNIILVTHAAGDHVGQAFDIMKQSEAVLVCDVATKFRAMDEGGISEKRIYHMVSGVEYVFNDIAVKALPVRHHSFAKTTKGYISAQPLSYLLKSSTGERIYCCGDTSIHGDLKLYGELYKPDLALLGVGGVDVHGQSLTELYPDEAALVAKWLGVHVAIPTHYRGQEGKEFLTELAKRAPNVKGLALKPGEKYVLRL